MDTTQSGMMSLEEAAGVLGVDLDADPQRLRDAYVQQIRAHPPESDPDAFERVRDAHAALSDAGRRASHLLMADPDRTLVSLLDDDGGTPAFVGPKPWINALGAKPGK